MFKWFGPSKFSQVLDLMQEDRAVRSAEVAAQTALLSSMVAGVTAQAELARQHLALLTAPTEPPRVRTMTRADEARYEQAREAKAPTKVINTDTLLGDVFKQFETDFPR